MNINEYNGWTNYATWRVNLELFSDMDYKDYFDEFHFKVIRNKND